MGFGVPMAEVRARARRGGALPLLAALLPCLLCLPGGDVFQGIISAGGGPTRGSLLPSELVFNLLELRGGGPGRPRRAVAKSPTHTVERGVVAATPGRRGRGRRGGVRDSGEAANSGRSDEGSAVESDAGSRESSIVTGYSTLSLPSILNSGTRFGHQNLE